MPESLKSIVDSSLTVIRNHSRCERFMVDEAGGSGAGVAVKMKVRDIDVLSDKLRRLLPDTSSRDDALKVMTNRWHAEHGDSLMGQQILAADYVRSNINVGGKPGVRLIRGLRSDWLRLARRLLPPAEAAGKDAVDAMRERERVMTVSYFLRTYRRGLEHLMQSFHDDVISSAEVGEYRTAYESLVLRTTTAVIPVDFQAVNGLEEGDAEFPADESSVFRPLEALEHSSWFGYIISATDALERAGES